MGPMGEGIFSRAMRYAAVSGLVSVGASAAPSPRSRQGEWTLTLGARESNEFSRIFNGSRAGGPDSGQGQLRISGYLTRTARSQYGLFGRVGANAYREGDSRERSQLRGRFLLESHIPSERFNSTSRFGADRGFQAETLSNLGVLAPGADSSAAQRVVGTSVPFEPQDHLYSTSVSYDYLRFESDQPIPGSQIVRGQDPVPRRLPAAVSGPSDDGELPLPDAEAGSSTFSRPRGFS